MRRTLTLPELVNYRGTNPLESRLVPVPDVKVCFLIVDPGTAHEISTIQYGSQYGRLYQGAWNPARDLNEIVDLLNEDIENGRVPYYWSRTQQRYYPISRVLRIERTPSMGLSVKESGYQVIVRVGTLERPVNINSICAIDEVEF
jgi:hypothetical protein